MNLYNYLFLIKLYPSRQKNLSKIFKKKTFFGQFQDFFRNFFIGIQKIPFDSQKPVFKKL